MATGKLFVISAPSGSGKTSLVKEVLEDCGKKYPLQRAVTYTTRPAREGEVDGDHYHFVSIDEFKELIAKNAFIEWSTWYDHYYGSPLSIIEEAQKGTSFIMVLDRSGAQEVLKVFPKAVLIWIEPPSVKILEERLVKRGADNQAAIENRLRKAHIEMKEEQEAQLYQYHIINDDFKIAVDCLKEIFVKELEIDTFS